MIGTSVMNYLTLFRHSTFSQKQFFFNSSWGVFTVNFEHIQCDNLAFTYSKSTMETPEERVKYDFNNKVTRTISMVSLYLTLSRIHTFFWRFHCRLWTSNCWLGQGKFCCYPSRHLLVQNQQWKHQNNMESVPT